MEGQTTDNQTSTDAGSQVTAGSAAGAADESFTSVTDSIAAQESTADEGEKKASASTGAGDKADKKTEEVQKQEEAHLAAWGDQLTDEIKGNADMVKQLAKFQKLPDLAKSYCELEKKLGNSVTLPGKDATAEEKAAFMARLGVPEKEDGYKCTASLDGQQKSFVNKLLFSSGLTEEQGEKMVKSMAAIGQWQKESYLAHKKEAEAALEADLHKEYGADYGTKMASYKKGLVAAGAGVVKALQEAGLTTNKELVRYFVKAGEYGSEGASPNKTDRKAAEYKSVKEGGVMSFFSK